MRANGITETHDQADVEEQQVQEHRHEDDYVECHSLDSVHRHRSGHVLVELQFTLHEAYMYVQAPTSEAYLIATGMCTCDAMVLTLASGRIYGVLPQHLIAA
eukprot:COSAG01_NODE_19461_length_1008_cov_1.616062_2_plen_102_part_00